MPKNFNGTQQRNFNKIAQDRRTTYAAYTKSAVKEIFKRPAYGKK